MNATLRGEPLEEIKKDAQEFAEELQKVPLEKRNDLKNVMKGYVLCAQADNGKKAG